MFVSSLRQSIILGVSLLVMCDVRPAAAQTPAELVQRAWSQHKAQKTTEALATLGTLLEHLRITGNVAPADLAFVLNEQSVLNRSLGSGEAAYETAAKAVDLLDGAKAETDLLAAALVNKGLAAQDQARLTEAYALFQRTEFVARLLGRADLVTSALGLMASAALGDGRYRQAQVDAERAIALLAGEASFDRLASLQHLRAQALLAQRSPGLALDALSSVGDVSLLPQRLLLENILLRGRAALQEARPELAERLLAQVVAQARVAAPDLWASALYNLSEVEFSRGRYVAAEVANQRAEAAYLEVFGERHPVIGQIRHRQAVILQQVGDLDLALSQFDAAQALLDRSLGRDHPLSWATVAERSRTLSLLGRDTEALDATRDVLNSAAYRSGEVGASRILALAALGLALKDAGDIPGAIAVLEQVRGAREDSVYSVVDEPPGLNALAEMYLSVGRIDEARSAAERSIDILDQMRASSVDSLGEAKRLRADVALSEGDRTTALRLVRENVKTAEYQLVELARTESYASDFAPVALRKQLAQALNLLVKDAGTVPEMFQAAQLVHLNEAARATNGVLKAALTESPAVAEALRERRDLSDAIRTVSALVAQGSATLSDLKRLDELRTQKAQVDSSISAMASELDVNLSPSPVSLAEVQRRLDKDEALWLHAVPGERAFLFLVTAEAVFFAETDLGDERLDKLVRRIRLTLDQKTGAGLIPFDFAAAAEVYQGLFAPFEEQLAHIKRLVLIPDAAAQQLALGTLVRSVAPSRITTDGADARFLGLTHALSVLPSVSSFVALDRVGRPASEQRDFFGFGDPVLGGDGTGFRGSPIDHVTGFAKVGAVSSLFEPLPETVYELTQMAQAVPQSQRNLFLGAAATETAVKELDLRKAGTMVFATHAIVSGDFDYLSEPGLVMTPPTLPSEQDDGLLTASEIARLTMDVDLVILSACNTGSPSGRSGAPGLTGLAAGFFRAGAGNLVVSQWTIMSLTSVLLMPTFFSGMAGENAVPPSEAMRRAMVEVSTRPGNEGFAHPAVWGPFIVVGRR